jgi:hypothetical protein
MRGIVSKVKAAFQRKRCLPCIAQAYRGRSQ